MTYGIYLLQKKILKSNKEIGIFVQNKSFHLFTLKLVRGKLLEQYNSYQLVIDIMENRWHI